MATSSKNKFKVGDSVFNRKYGAGFICKIKDKNTYTVRLDIANENLPIEEGGITVKLKESELAPLSIKINDRVKSKNLGYGTVRKVHIVPDICIRYLIEFDRMSQELIYLQKKRGHTTENNFLWCSAKYDCDIGFKVVEEEIRLPCIDPLNILRDIYENVKRDLPDREEDFLSNVKQADIKILKKEIDEKVEDWAEKYGYFIQKGNPGF